MTEKPPGQVAFVGCPKCGKMWGEFLSGIFMRVCTECKLRIVIDTTRDMWYVVK